MEIREEIQLIKEKFGQDAERILADEFGIAKKGSKYQCPNGVAHKHNDKSPSMAWDSKALQLYCFACEEKIDIYTYFRKVCNYTHREIVREVLGEDVDGSKKLFDARRDFEDKIKHLQPLSDECRKYINLRGISDSTIEEFGVMTLGKYIAFVYYGDNGWSIVACKKRLPCQNPDPKMTSVTGSKPCLYNSRNVPPGGDELIICEGEFDAMVLYECGFKNVVSVGAGAKSAKLMIDNHFDYIDSFKTIIVVSDDDDAGIAMAADFLEAFGVKVKLVDREMYRGSNDVNALLFRGGEKGHEMIRELIESARWKIKGRRDLDNQPYRGVAGRNDHFIPTGIDSIDYAINDLRNGMVTLIVGRTNGGKTTFVRQIIANAVDLGNKVYVLLGEGNQEYFINSLYQCVIGNDCTAYDIVKINKREHKEPKKRVLNALKRWHNGKLVIFNKGESQLQSTEELFDMLEMEVKLNQHNLVVIDNLMSVLKASSREKLEAQADFMQRCHDLAEAYNTHIILILHPNKTYVKGNDLELEQASGTMDLANKADNVLAVIRSYDEDEIAVGIMGRIAVTKNRYYSETPVCNTSFDIETGQIMEIINGTMVGYNFKWRNYLDKEQEQIKM